jgi:hypothetical protein
MRVSALPELQAYPLSFSPPPKAAMEAREFIRVRLHEVLHTGDCGLTGRFADDRTNLPLKGSFWSQVFRRKNNE